MSLTAIFSKGYEGYASASNGTGAPGFFFYSGSVSGSESQYSGIGMEMAHASASMRFSTTDNSLKIQNLYGTVLDAVSGEVNAVNSARQIYTNQPVVQITGSAHQPVGGSFITNFMPGESVLTVIGRLQHFRTGSGTLVGDLRLRFRAPSGSAGQYGNWDGTATEDYTLQKQELKTDYSGSDALYFRFSFLISSSINNFNYLNRLAEVQVEIAPTGSNATCSISDFMVYASGIQSAVFLISGNQL